MLFKCQGSGANLKLPKKLKAFGRTYDIVSDDDITRQFDVYGMMHPGKESISLQKRCGNFSEQKEASTFLHEILHVVDENLRAGLEEEQINLLAVGLYSIIQDNNLSFLDEASK